MLLYRMTMLLVCESRRWIMQRCSQIGWGVDTRRSVTWATIDFVRPLIELLMWDDILIIIRYHLLRLHFTGTNCIARTCQEGMQMWSDIGLMIEHHILLLLLILVLFHFQCLPWLHFVHQSNHKVISCGNCICWSNIVDCRDRIQERALICITWA